jgi:hypothetical protein
MALTLADFDPVACSSRFDVSASQYRSLNRHRIILEVTGDGRAFTDRELRIIKQELGRQDEIRIGSTSAFGMILKGFEFSPADVEKWVDNFATQKPVCQWIVAVDGKSKAADGVHTWMKGATTPIYEGILGDFEAQGYEVSNRAKHLRGFMKFAMMLNFWMWLSRYNP